MEKNDGTIPLFYSGKKNNGTYNIGLCTTIAIELWFTMGKIWFYTKNDDSTPKYTELWFTVKKLWYCIEKHGTLNTGIIILW